MSDYITLLSVRERQALKRLSTQFGYANAEEFVHMVLKKIIDDETLTLKAKLNFRQRVHQLIKGQTP